MYFVIKGLVLFKTRSHMSICTSNISIKDIYFLNPITFEQECIYTHILCILSWMMLAIIPVIRWWRVHLEASGQRSELLVVVVVGGGGNVNDIAIYNHKSNQWYVIENVLKSLTFRLQKMWCPEPWL